MNETTIDEIAPKIYRISTCMPELVEPMGGFTFNQFLIDDDEPLLHHTGMRAMFPLVSAAVAKILPPEKVRWLTFSHVTADHNGSMNEWLEAAPHAQVAHGFIGCMTAVGDLAIRPPRQMYNGEVIELGEKRARYIDTPHVPLGWEACMLYEEVTKTLFCGDLFAHCGDGPPLTTDDIVQPTMVAEDIFHAGALTPDLPPTIRTLAELEPSIIAPMHGSSFNGDCVSALHGLADAYQGRLNAAIAQHAVV